MDVYSDSNSASSNEIVVPEGIKQYYEQYERKPNDKLIDEQIYDTTFCFDSHYEIIDWSKLYSARPGLHLIVKSPKIGLFSNLELQIACLSQFRVILSNFEIVGGGAYGIVAAVRDRRNDKFYAMKRL